MSTSSVSGYASLQAKLFSRIDANSDGKATKDEFVAARPQDVSESQASALFGKLDSSGAGFLTESDLTQGAAASTATGDAAAGAQTGLSSDMLGSLLQILQGSGSQTTGARTASGTPPTAAETFAKMDANGDGSVSKGEFLAALPDGVSEDQASSLYDSIETGSSGSVTLSQLDKSVPHGGGGGGMKAPSSSSGADSTTYDPLDTNQDGVVSLEELMAGDPDDAQAEVAGSQKTDGSLDGPDALQPGGLSLNDSQADDVRKADAVSVDGGSPVGNAATANLKLLTDAMNAYQASYASANQPNAALLLSA
ncbi:MAG TPA: hypothetical protein VGO34_09910 [Alphaproteobacteria bacterium]|jgi:Ca2+-binding EF-hand superfamily protein